MPACWCMASKTLYMKAVLDGKMVGWTEISFDGLETYKQRWEHAEAVAAKLYEKHLTKIEKSRNEPEFFIDNVQSKMSGIDFKINDQDPLIQKMNEQ